MALSTGQINDAYQSALGRLPSNEEIQAAQRSGLDGDPGKNRLISQLRAAQSGGSVTAEMEQLIADQISELESKLTTVPGLTQEEMDSFLQKAIDQVTPYYEQKKSEIEAGIAEGKLQSAEDLLMEIRRVEQDTANLLQKYDIEQAQTEEEFVNTLAEITSSKEEDIAQKQLDWRDRITEAKLGLTQSGTLTSGIGQKKVGQLQERQNLDIDTRENRAEREQTRAETGQKYDLQKIALARQQAEQERIRKIGDTSQTQQTIGALEQSSGLNYGNLASEAELARQRAERNIPVYSPTALTDIEEERKRAVESRKLTLQDEAKAIKDQQAQAERQKIQNEIARKQRELNYFTG